MITLFCCKNQNSDKTVRLNNSTARAKVMPRSIQRLIVFRKVDTRWQFKVFWHQLLAHPKISLRLLLPVTKSFTDNAIALYSSCVCSSIAAMLRIFFTQFSWKVRGIIPPEFKTGGSIPPIPPVPTPMNTVYWSAISRPSPSLLTTLCSPSDSIIIIIIIGPPAQSL